MMWLALLQGCILGPRPEACTDNTGCREAFGFGNVCGAEGFCEPVAIEPDCKITYPEDVLVNPEKYVDALVIGTIFNVPFDEPQQLSAQLAIRAAREAERTDGSYGRPVAVVHCDNQPDADTTSVEEASRLANYLVDDLGVPAIVGPSTSDESFAVFDVASRAGAITISPSATSPTLTELGGLPNQKSPGLFWRTAPPDDLQAIVIADDLVNRGVESVVIIHQESSYATSLADSVDALFASGNRTSSVYSYVGAGEISEIIGPAFNEGTDEIVFFTSETSEVVDFLDGASNDPDRVGRPIFLADAAADSSLFEVNDGEVMLPFIRGTRPQIPDGNEFETFSTYYLTTYDQPPDASVFTSYAYDAAWLALYGALWADINGEPVDGNSIGRGIQQLSQGETIPVGISSVRRVRAAFEAGDGADIQGASGSLDFDATTGEVANPIEVWRVEDGDFVPVRVCEPGGTCTELEEDTTTTK